MDRTYLVVGVVVGCIFAAAVFIAWDPFSGPDRVVGVILKCDVKTYIKISEPAYRPTTGPACNSNEAINARHEVTVRTPKGTVYTVEAPDIWLIRLGDSWPPK